MRSSPSRWVTATGSQADTVKWARLWITEQASQPHTTHSWSIYHGPLVWSCFAGSAAPPFIHPAVLRVFDHANVQGTLLSSLGSSCANSPGLCRLVMTTDRARRAGLIVLIRWGILGNAALRLIDLFCVWYQSWHQPHIATLGMSDWCSPYKLPGYCVFNWQNGWNHIMKNKKWRWWTAVRRRRVDMIMISMKEPLLQCVCVCVSVI